jgi:hypothetical protein
MEDMIKRYFFFQSHPLILDCLKNCVSYFFSIFSVKLYIGLVKLVFFLFQPSILDLLEVGFRNIF